jgi:hypothetical protein
MSRRDARLQTLTIGGRVIPRGGPVNGTFYTITRGTRSEITRGESVTVASRVANPEVTLTVQVLSADAARAVLEQVVQSYDAGLPLVASGNDNGIAWSASECYPVEVGNIEGGAAEPTLSYSFALAGVNTVVLP